MSAGRVTSGSPQENAKPARQAADAACLTARKRHAYGLFGTIKNCLQHQVALMAALRAMGALAVQGSRPALPCRLATSLGRLNKQMQQHRQLHTAQKARVASTRAAASAGGAPPASPAPTTRPAADSSSAAARPLPRVVLKGGKSKLFTGDAPSPMVSSATACAGIAQYPYLQASPSVPLPLPGSARPPRPAVHNTR